MCQRDEIIGLLGADRLLGHLDHTFFPSLNISGGGVSKNVHSQRRRKIAIKCWVLYLI